MVAWSLGLSPFKDVFWTTSKQPGNPYGANIYEPNPQLQTLVSVLSAGLVGFGDKIGLTNKTLIMQTCAEDGLLLKPDKPATSIDRSFLPQRPQGEVWTSYSHLGGYYWYYCLGADMKKPFSLLLSDLYSPSYNNVSKRAFHWNNPQGLPIFSEDHPIHFPVYNDNNWPFDYFIVIPSLKNRFLILGELTKFVTLSKQRFLSLEEYTNSISLVITGSPQEVVKISISHESVETIITSSCVIESHRRANLQCTFDHSLHCIC